jgi:hypothetical protein
MLRRIKQKHGKHAAHSTTKLQVGFTIHISTCKRSLTRTPEGEHIMKIEPCEGDYPYFGEKKHMKI